MPAVARQCVDQFRHLHPAPAWSVVLLHDGDIPADRDDVRALAACHRADWVRLQTLARHGGVWLDATCALLLPVTAWVDLGGGAGEDVQGFRTVWTPPRRPHPRELGVRGAGPQPLPPRLVPGVRRRRACRFPDVLRRRGPHAH